MSTFFYACPPLSMVKDYRDVPVKYGAVPELWSFIPVNYWRCMELCSSAKKYFTALLCNSKHICKFMETI